MSKFKFSRIFKENYNFLRFQWGPTFSKGCGGPNFPVVQPFQGVLLLLPMETFRNGDFAEGVWTPCPPVPALDSRIIFTKLLKIMMVVCNDDLRCLKLP